MRWLHLSDLHIIDKADWYIFKTELIQHCEKKGPIDLVIVTGDFHDFKEADDFSKAESFLCELMTNLNLDIKKDLFLIPGNHDGSNPICEHKLGNVTALKKYPQCINGKEWNELVEQFNSYEMFIKELIPGYPCEHPAREHCRTWNNKINFIHCNSAVVSDSTDKDEQLLDIDTFTKLALESKLPSIVLIHNNINDIHKDLQDRMKSVIRNSNIKAYFCGDRHIQQIDMIKVSDRQNSQVPCIGSYKSAPYIGDTYSSYGVIIGTWVDEKAELEGWTWTIEGSFRLDDKITGHTIEMGEKYTDEFIEVGSENNCSIQIFKEDCNEQHKNVDITEKEQQFRKLFFNMSDIQREKVNTRFVKKVRHLEKNETIYSIHEFFEDMMRNKCVDEVIEYIKKLYDEG